MVIRNLYLVFFFLIFYSATPGGKASRKEVKILFVGNSLTYVNDLPALIKEIAKQDGITVSYTSFLYPDYSLEDHWNEGKVKAEIEKEAYDFVLAQQGPSALRESQVLLIDYASRFSEVCKKNNSKLALYMVWPSKARSFDLDNVINSYTKAAQHTRSILCPAGLAWKNAWAVDSLLALYSPDNFHPSLSGSVLAALTIYGCLENKNDFDFIKLQNCSWKDEMSEIRLEVFKRAALNALHK